MDIRCPPNILEKFLHMFYEVKKCLLFKVVRVFCVRRLMDNSAF